MITQTDNTENKVNDYSSMIRECVPMYRTTLVKEIDVPYQQLYRAKTSEDAFNLFKEYFSDRPVEEFHVLHFNTALRVIGIHRVSIGGLAASIVEPREVMRGAILNNAASIILAHNHVSGNPKPSREDIAITKRIAEVGKVMGIPVHDHIIVAGDTFTSMSEIGLIP